MIESSREQWRKFAKQMSNDLKRIEQERKKLVQYIKDNPGGCYYVDSTDTIQIA